MALCRSWDILSPLGDHPHTPSSRHASDEAAGTQLRSLDWRALLAAVCLRPKAISHRCGVLFGSASQDPDRGLNSQLVAGSRQ